MNINQAIVEAFQKALDVGYIPVVDGVVAACHVRIKHEDGCLPDVTEDHALCTCQNLAVTIHLGDPAGCRECADSGQH